MTDFYFVQLGRYGDIMNILPWWKHLGDQGHRVHVVVSEKFASIFAGTSYIYPIVVKWEPDEIDKCMASFAGLNLIRSQAFMHPASTLTAQNFCQRQWMLAHADLTLYHVLPLVFDRRCQKREKVLVESQNLNPSKKTILFNFKGFSSPFNEDAELRSAIEATGYNLVDLSKIEAEYIFDLLGLYERADLLISIDTATLHLAYATKTPVIALSHPNPGADSERRDFWIGHFRYNAFRVEEILSLIKRQLEISGS